VVRCMAERLRKGWWGAHRGGGVGGGGRPRFHSGDVPLAGGSGQGVEEGPARGDLAEEEGARGEKIRLGCG
jgi:hypothetical protein